MRCCDQEQIDGPQALAPAAIALTQYLVQREHLKKPKNLLDEDAFIDHLITEAKAARRRFHKIAAGVLRKKRLRAATGQLAQDYRDIVKHIKIKRDLTELVDEALKFPDVQTIFERSGVPRSLITALRDTIKKAAITVETEQETLIITNRQGKHYVINDAEDLTIGNDLLEQVSHSWPTRGQGLITTVTRPPQIHDPLRISWKNSVAEAAVQGLSFFDREIRTLEDLRSLPAAEGSAGAAIVLIAVVVQVVVGFILTWISECVDDPDAAVWLKFIGDLHLTFGIGSATGTTSLVACRTDPSGARRCASISIRI